MTPQEFIAKWKPANLTERGAAQEHFLTCASCSASPSRRPPIRKGPGTPSSAASTKPAAARAGPTSGEKPLSVHLFAAFGESKRKDE